MKDLEELGAAVAARRKDHHLTQAKLAHQSGITRELVARFEGGRVAEFGTRKLLSVLASLGMELTLIETGTSGSLDELRRERGGA
jgi:transcriptional regulator with XRE-family HTH domain